MNLSIAELVLKQWALDTVFSPEVKRAHDTGAVHVHDLGYPHRVYCSHPQPGVYQKVRAASGWKTSTPRASRPARASVLTGHLNTFLASMQANYAGALGIGYINILYAPFLEDKDERQLKQCAQELVFNGSQNAFSRGGQTLFLDFNIHTGVPRYMLEVPAVGPGGHYLLRLADGSRRELLERRTDQADHKGRLADGALRAGRGQRAPGLPRAARPADRLHPAGRGARGRAGRPGRAGASPTATTARSPSVSPWPCWRCSARATVTAGSSSSPSATSMSTRSRFNDPGQHAILRRACELASQNGSTYFVFDRDEVTLSACCRLRTTINDNYLPCTPRACGSAASRT